MSGGQIQTKRASNAAYVVVGLIGLGASIFGFVKGTEIIGDRRELPGWVLACIGLFLVVAVAYILWRRSRGEYSRLEDT